MSAARAGYGAALLFVPARLLALGTGSPLPGSAVAVARVLGARHLVQSTVTVARPTGWIVRAGAVVDTLHGSSQVGLAAISPRWRRVALADAAIAALLVATARNAGRNLPRHRWGWSAPARSARLGTTRRRWSRLSPFAPGTIRRPAPARRR